MYSGELGYGKIDSIPKATLLAKANRFSRQSTIPHPRPSKGLMMGNGQASHKVSASKFGLLNIYLSRYLEVALGLHLMPVLSQETGV